jgi:hypothetical protein
MVEQLSFEVDFADEDEALASQGWLERFVKQRAMAVIEEVFDEWPQPVQVVAIDRLEVDLGPSRGPADEAELEQRLRERLRAALHEAAASTDEGARTLARPAAQLAALQRFLETGRLRWNDGADIDALAHEVARSSPDALASHLLQPGAAGEAMRRRWRAQFGDEHWPELARAWHLLEQALCGDDDGPGWQGCARAWQALLAREPARLRGLIVRLGRSARVRRRIAARFAPAMLGELLGLLAGAHAQGFEAVAAEALRRHPGSAALVWEGLLAHLCLEAHEAIRPPALPELLAWIDERRPPPVLPGPAPADPLDIHRGRLLAALAGSVDPGLEADWQVLAQEDPAWLRSQLQRWGRSAHVRRMIARRFPPALRMRLLFVLAPAEGAFLATVLGTGGLVAADASAAMSRAVEQGLWELCLAHLAGGGAGQGRRACLDALLHGLSHTLLAGDAQATERVTLRLRLLGAAEGPQRQLLQSLDAVAANGPRDEVELALLRLRVEAALASGETEGMAAAWRVLMRRDRAGLRAALRRQGRRSAVHQLAAQRFPPAMRLELLALLAPGEHEAIVAFITHATAWQAGSQAMAGTDVERWLWAQALAPLLGAPGAVPDAAACIAAMLQQMAQAQAVALRELVPQLRAQLQRVQPGTAATQRVLRILDQLQPARPQLPQPATPVPEAAAQGGLQARIAALCARLQQQAPLSIDEARHWQAEARGLLASHAGALRPALRAALEAPDASVRLAGLLPSAQLAEVLQLLRPADHERARSCVRLVTQACAGLQAAPPPARLERLGWQFLLRDLVEEGRRFAAAAFSGRFIDYLAGKLRWGARAGWRDAVRDAIGRMAGSASPALAREVAAGACDAMLEASPPADLSEPVYVSDAGLVLASPYLVRLFDRVGLLQGKAFADEQAEDRALHLLHFMASGAAQPAEPRLALPRLLCGVDGSRPVERRIELSAQEREAAEGLLQAMIQHWKILGRTSVDGLRETFLQREGKLLRDREAWQLVVAAGPFDMLLDQLPWGYAPVKLPWMPEVLHVQWR